MTLCSLCRADAVSVSSADGPATPPLFQEDSVDDVLAVYGCGVRELAKPIEAVCEVADEEACAKRVKMHMMTGLVMVRIFDDGSERGQNDSR